MLHITKKACMTTQYRPFTKLVYGFSPQALAGILSAVKAKCQFREKFVNSLLAALKAPPSTSRPFQLPASARLDQQFGAILRSTPFTSAPTSQDRDRPTGQPPHGSGGGGKARKAPWRVPNKLRATPPCATWGYVKRFQARMARKGNT